MSNKIKIIFMGTPDFALPSLLSLIQDEDFEVMAVVTACFEAMRTDCDRISTQIKIDYRAGPGGRIKAKVAAVEGRLGRKLST